MERKWLILTSVSLGSLMATLDGSIVNIALPAMQIDFQIDLTTIEWVVVRSIRKSFWIAGRAMLTMLPSSVAMSDPSDTLVRMSHLRSIECLGAAIEPAVRRPAGG